MQKRPPQKAAATQLGLAGPDAGGEGFYGGEAEAFVEVDGGFVFGGYGESEFLEFLSAEGIRGREHQKTPQAVALEAGLHAYLRSVADAGRHFAGEDRSREIVATRVTKDERSLRKNLAAAGQQDDVLQKTQGTVPRAVLIVDVSIHVIGIRQID